MRIKFTDRGLTVKEFLKVLERILTEQSVTSINTPNVYIGTSKAIVTASLKKSEIDLEGHEQEGFDEVSF